MSCRIVFVIDAAFDKERHKRGYYGPRKLAAKLAKKGRVDVVLATTVKRAINAVVRGRPSDHGKPPKIRLLRFYGHGGPGVQNVGGNHNFNNDDTLLKVVDGELLHYDSLVQLKPLFTRHARIELHGCQAGADEGIQEQKDSNGKVVANSVTDKRGRHGELLVRMANDLNVEVRAATLIQHSRTAHEADVPQGATVFAKPGFRTVLLNAW
jgi:hypothetical protein